VGGRPRLRRSVTNAESAAGVIGERLVVPQPVTNVVRLGVFCAACALIWWRSRSSATEPQRLVELSTVALVAGFLLSTFAFPFYGVYLVPLAVSAATPSSYVHHWVTWAALYCVGAKEAWQLDRFPDRLNDVLSARVTFGFLLVLVAIYLGIRRAEAAAPAVTAARGLAPNRAEVDTGAEP
jgi:hypothetical protein